MDETKPAGNAPQPPIRERESVMTNDEAAGQSALHCIRKREIQNLRERARKEANDFNRILKDYNSVRKEIRQKAPSGVDFSEPQGERSGS